MPAKGKMTPAGRAGSPPLPRGGGMAGGIKGEEQDDDDGGRKKVAAASGGGEGEGAAEIEALSLGEFNRWLVTEANWKSAEECREQHIEGEQFRKARDDRHRERGQMRQQDTVEQMKEAKTRVDAQRRLNLEAGAAVKREVIAWNAAAQENAAARIKAAKEIKEAQIKAKGEVDEKAIHLAMKKEIAASTRKDDEYYKKEGQRIKEQISTENKKVVEKVKGETSDVAIDEAKKTFFLQRKAKAKETSTAVDQWNNEKAKNAKSFLEKQSEKVSLVKSMREGARSARDILAALKREGASTVRDKRSGLISQREDNASTHIMRIKANVNSEIGERFVPPDASRQMIQHPHYSEVSAVATDITSTISKEIAASPKKLRRPIAMAAAQQITMTGGNSPSPSRR